MKVRLYKCPDGSVVVDTPSMRYQDRIEECPHPGRFRNGEPFEMEVIDYEDLKTMAVNNEAGSGQFFHENGVVKHDNDWSEILMHPELIRIKQRKRLTDQLDQELEKQNPDAVVVVKLQREREKLKELKEKDLYEIALANLDQDSHQKPKIRAKLQEKIR